MAFFEEPMCERTRRYRRNVLAISFIAIAIGLSGNIDFSNAQLFGIGFHTEKPCEKSDGAEWTFWLLMLLLFVYQSASFVRYARSDFLIWHRSTRRTMRDLEQQDNKDSLEKQAPLRADTAVAELNVRMRQFKLWDLLLPVTGGVIAAAVIVYRIWKLT